MMRTLFALVLFAGVPLAAQQPSAAPTVDVQKEIADLKTQVALMGSQVQAFGKMLAEIRAALPREPGGAANDRAKAVISQALIDNATVCPAWAEAISVTVVDGGKLEAACVASLKDARRQQKAK